MSLIIGSTTKPKPIYYLSVSVMTHSKTLDIIWKNICYTIPLHDKLNLEEIHQSFLSKITEISVLESKDIEKSRFFLFVLGERLSKIDDHNKEKVKEVLSEIQNKKLCMFVEDTSLKI